MPPKVIEDPARSPDKDFFPEVRQPRHQDLLAGAGAYCLQISLRHSKGFDVSVRSIQLPDRHTPRRHFGFVRSCIILLTSVLPSESGKSSVFHGRCYTGFPLTPSASLRFHRSLILSYPWDRQPRPSARTLLPYRNE